MYSWFANCSKLLEPKQKEPLGGGGEVVETIKNLKKKRSKETKLERERERELTFFAMNNLEGIGERGGNEVK